MGLSVATELKIRKALCKFVWRQDHHVVVKLQQVPVETRHPRAVHFDSLSDPIKIILWLILEGEKVL